MGEERKNNRKTKENNVNFGKVRKIIFVMCILILILSIIVWYFLDNYKYNYEEYSGEYQNYYLYCDNNYFYDETMPAIYTKIYSAGPYIIKNYNIYTQFIELIESDNPIIYKSGDQIEAIEGLDESFFDDKSIILCFATGLLDVQENDNIANLKLYKDGYYTFFDDGGGSDTSRILTYGFNVYFISVSKDITKINVSYESGPTFTTEKNICKAIIAISICIIIAMQISNINKILKQYSKQIKTAIKNIFNVILIIWMMFNLLYAFYVLYSNVIGMLELCTIRHIYRTYYISCNYDLWYRKGK